MNFNPVFLSELGTSAGTPKLFGQKIKSPSYLFSDIINVIKDDAPNSQESSLSGLCDIVNTDFLGNTNKSILSSDKNLNIKEDVQNKNLASILNSLKANLTDYQTTKETANTNQINLKTGNKNLFEYQNIDEGSLLGILKEILNKVDNVEIEVGSDKLDDQNLKIEKNKSQKININDLLKYIFQQISQNGEVKLNLFAGKDKIEIDLSKSEPGYDKNIVDLSNGEVDAENPLISIGLNKEQTNSNTLIDKLEKILNSEKDINVNTQKSGNAQIENAAEKTPIPEEIDQLNKNIVSNVSSENSNLSDSNQSFELKDQKNISIQNMINKAGLNLDNKNIELETDKSLLKELDAKFISNLKKEKPAGVSSTKSQIMLEDKMRNSTENKSDNESVINSNLKDEIKNILNIDLQDTDEQQNKSNDQSKSIKNNIENIQKSETKQNIVNKKSIKIDNSLQQKPDEKILAKQTDINTKNDKPDYDIKINIESNKNNLPKSFFEEIEVLSDKKPDLILNKSDKVFKAENENKNLERSALDKSKSGKSDLQENSKNEVDVIFKISKKINDQSVKLQQNINTNKADEISNKINAFSFNDNELLENVAGLNFSKLNSKSNLQSEDQNKNVEKNVAKVKSLSNSGKTVDSKINTNKDFNDTTDKKENKNSDQIDINNQDNNSKGISNIINGSSSKVSNNSILKTANIVNNTLKELLNSANIKNYSRIDGNKNSKTITMKLSPEYLGKVKVSLDVQDNSVKANIEVEDQTVRNIIQNNISQLRQSITNQGLVLSSLNISLSNQETKQNKTYQAKKKTHSNFKIDNMISQEVLSTPKSLGYNTYEYLI